VELERPDGARIHYEVRGEGPLVVLALGFAAMPSVYEPMIGDLARDHAVAVWHPSGCGLSPPAPPHSLRRDADDLAALIAELRGQAKVFAAGHGINVAARASGCVTGLVAHGVTTALLDDLKHAEGLGTSRLVAEMLAEQLRTDPRACIRAMAGSLNPQLSEAELRDRIEATLAYIDIPATLERVDSWFTDDSVLPQLRGFGGRLTILTHEGDTWQEDAIDDVSALLPEAGIASLEDGPLSRPDLAAGLVRDLR
jgi:pimeloyl-ACP methyl ester carboxylesterase